VSGLVSFVFIYKSSLKMVALILNCSTVDQQDVILFCDQKELKTSETYYRMLAQYGEHGMGQKNVICSTTTHVHVTWHLLFKQSGSSNLNFSHISHTVQT